MYACGLSESDYINKYVHVENVIQIIITIII